MRGRTWPTSVTQPITQPSHASTHTLHSKYQGGDPTRSFHGGASTRKQARRLGHNSCLVQPPGPRGADDNEDKVHDAAATSTEEGQRPGSPQHKAPPGKHGPSGQTRPSPTGQWRATHAAASLRAYTGARPPAPVPDGRRDKVAPRLQSGAGAFHRSGSPGRCVRNA